VRKHCTICGQVLRLWERMQGRFDHQGCRERSIVKIPCDNNERALPFSKPNAHFKIARTSR
jgi:hypothetical protein